jgi:hypothetical protein
MFVDMIQEIMKGEGEEVLILMTDSRRLSMAV